MVLLHSSLSNRARLCLQKKKKEVGRVCLPTKIVTGNTWSFSLQAKLLFSDGEKVIPRLTHELPGIKVRVTVFSGIGAGGPSGWEASEICGPREVPCTSICRTRSTQHHAGWASLAWVRAGLESCSPGLCLLQLQKTCSSQALAFH